VDIELHSQCPRSRR